MEVTYPDVYDLGRQIGEGSFGSVHLAVSRLTGRNYVVKEVRTSGLNKYGQLNLTFLLGRANANALKFFISAYSKPMKKGPRRRSVGIEKKIKKIFYHLKREIFHVY